MTPRPAATLLLTREGDGGPQVLMLERPTRGAFGGMWVFPGGAVEEVDHSPLAAEAVSGADDHQDFPWRAAALRETVEEVGLALAVPPATIRLDGESAYSAVLTAGSRLDAGSLRLLSQWVTPEGRSPRFDTRFYLAVVEGDPVLMPHHREVIDLCWVRPAAALDRNATGEWMMVPPTIHHLRWLAGFRSVGEAWVAARDLTFRKVTPRLEPDGSVVIGEDLAEGGLG